MKPINSDITTYRVQALERALDIPACFGFQDRITLPIHTHHRSAGLDRMVDLVKNTCETISSTLGYPNI